MIVTGIEGVREALAQRLRSELPSALAVLETQLELQSGALVDALTPKLIATSEIQDLGVNDFPAILVVANNITGHTTVSVDIGHSEDWHPAFDADAPRTVDAVQYSRTYLVRSWVYVHGANMNFDSTSQLRDRLELAIWRVIFGGLQLADNARINPDVYEVALADVVEGRFARALTGFYAGVQIEVTEGVSTPAAGVADTIQVIESRLP